MSECAVQDMARDAVPPSSIPIITNLIQSMIDPILEDAFAPPSTGHYFKTGANPFAQFFVKFGVAVALNPRNLCKTPVS
jgi:hypothetical protein